MPDQDGSSEEFVDEESEEEEEASSASFDSEEDGDNDAGDGSEDDVFQPKQPPKKKGKKTVTKTPKAPKATGAGAKGKGRAGSAGAVKANESTKDDEIPATPMDATPVQGTPSSETPTPTPGASDNSVVPCTPVQATPTESLTGSSSKKPPSGGRGGGATGGGAKTPKAAVSDYMAKANRPYSAINVFDNLHKKIPKAMVQKLLDELVSAGTVKLQEYGKSKIYYANQDTLPGGAGDVSDAKLARLDQESKELTTRLEIVAAQAREAQSRAQALASQPTDASLEENLASTTREIEKLEARNDSIKGQGHTVVAGGMDKAKKEFTKYRSLWVNRKRNVMDVVDMISDGMEKKPKQVMEMVGVEADEEPLPPKM